MENYLNICVTCLSVERRLISVKNIATILQDINLTELQTNKGGICWECRAIISKFHRFKIKSFHAQAILSQHKRTKNIKTFSNLVSKIHLDVSQYSYIFDPLSEDQLKTQQGDIKEECNEDAMAVSSIEENAQNDETASNREDSESKIENIFVETININENNKKSKFNREEFDKKFTKIVFSEAEVMRNREIKSNHYNFKKIPFKCVTCVLGFTKKETYDLHMKKKHNEKIGQYLCDVCKCRFSSEAIASSHKERHYTSYRCNLCRYDTTEVWAAVNHCTSKHANDQVDSIHCVQCEDVFKTPEDLEQHIQATHAVNCNECGVRFKGKHTLRSHKARVHCGSRACACAVCGRRFASAARLAAHVTSHGAALAQQLAYCRDCRVQFKSVHVYRTHLRNSANHAERKYACPECHKKFASKVYWSKHYNFYHLRKSRFNCEICNKLFISEWRLKNHRQKHHGLSRPREHSCDTCGNKFYTISMLRNHQLIHSEQRSYMCEDCGDTFKQRPALYTHCKLVHKRN